MNLEKMSEKCRHLLMGTAILVYKNQLRIGVEDAPQFQQGKSRKISVKQSYNIKRDEINMSIINENIF